MSRNVYFRPIAGIHQQALEPIGALGKASYRRMKRVACAAFLGAISLPAFCASTIQAQERPPAEQSMRKLMFMKNTKEMQSTLHEAGEELAGVAGLVQGSRTRRRIQDEPIRVKVIVR